MWNHHTVLNLNLIAYLNPLIHKYVAMNLTLTTDNSSFQYNSTLFDNGFSPYYSFLIHPLVCWCVKWQSWTTMLPCRRFQNLSTTNR